MVSTLITDAQLDTLYNYDPINNVSGGMTFDAEGNLYWTPSQFSSTGPHSGCVYRQRASDGSLSKIIDEADIKALTGSFGAVIFSDIYAAPDGNVYVYDRRDDVDAILYFDPDDPVDTLAIFLTESEIQSGPAGSGEVEILALGSFGSKLTWHHRTKFYDLYAKTLAGSPGDFDKDGNIDLWDAGAFQRCFDMIVSTNGACSHVDYNTTGVIDLSDWVEFEAGFAGPL